MGELPSLLETVYRGMINTTPLGVPYEIVRAYAVDRMERNRLEDLKKKSKVLKGNKVTYCPNSVNNKHNWSIKFAGDEKTKFCENCLFTVSISNDYKEFTLTKTGKPPLVIRPEPDRIKFKESNKKILFDMFVGSNFSNKWHWIEDYPVPNNIWSIANNRLRIKNCDYGILLQNAPSGSFEISTRLYFKPKTDENTAGICIIEDMENLALLQVTRELVDFNNPHSDKIVVYGKMSGTGGSVKKELLCVNDYVYLSMVFSNNSIKARISYDGQNWYNVNSGSTSCSLNPLEVGLISIGSPTAKAYFNYFKIEY
ncbi:hypothetical protein LCGC14_2806860 [marine sediment metagenome]|uniref:Beta-xylosidase C-terminal Concanavalin A-like domain-containing protein n=1 Tax=marine sediment metagenome TaxID=412755 RepID=A0A0F9BCE1_9ZZZZ